MTTLTIDPTCRIATLTLDGWPIEQDLSALPSSVRTAAAETACSLSLVGTLLPDRAEEGRFSPEIAAWEGAARALNPRQLHTRTLERLGLRTSWVQYLTLSPAVASIKRGHPVVLETRFAGTNSFVVAHGFYGADLCCNGETGDCAERIDGLIVFDPFTPGEVRLPIGTLELLVFRSPGKTGAGRIVSA